MRIRSSFAASWLRLARGAWALTRFPVRSYAIAAGAMCLVGLGHSGLALCAGLVGRSLLGEPAGWNANLVQLLCIGLGAAIVKALGQIALSYCEVHIGREVGGALRARVASTLLAAGSEVSRREASSLLAIRVREVEGAVQGGVLAGARAVAQLVPLGLALIFVSAPLAFGGVLLLAPFGLLLARFRSRLRLGMETAQRSAQDLHSEVDELVEHLDVFRSYGTGKKVVAAIERSAWSATRLEARTQAWRSAQSGANEVLGVGALLGLVLLVALSELPIEGPTLVAFAAVFFMAYRPLRDLGDARSRTLQGEVALDALLALGDPPATAPSIDDVPVSRPLAELSLLGFGARDRGVCVDVVVPPGQLVALVGATGSGKTTLLRAMLGLIPARGQLRFGESDVTFAPAGPCHRPFAWVPQDAPIVTGTVGDNVALCASDAEAAQNALEVVGATHLLQLGEVTVGPGGRALSGGERRLVALARAWATGLPVLLLDEPTEGLDAEAERVVLGALARLRGERTVVLVTHRPLAVAVADRVVRIDGISSAPSQAAE